MPWIKDVKIVPFRSCWKTTTAAVANAVRKKDDYYHGIPLATAPLFFAASSDEEEEEDAPRVVLRMHLHCAACARKIRRVAMDVPGVEKVATDVEAGRVTVAGTADAAVVAASVQVRTRRPVTVVRDGGGRTPRAADRVRRRAQVAPVARHPEEEGAAERTAREQAAAADHQWAAEVRIAGRGCGRCMCRVLRRVSELDGVREIKLTLPDRGATTTRCGCSSGVCGDDTRKNQSLLGPAGNC